MIAVADTGAYGLHRTMPVDVDCAQSAHRAGGVVDDVAKLLRRIRLWDSKLRGPQVDPQGSAGLLPLQAGRPPRT